MCCESRHMAMPDQWETELFLILLLPEKETMQPPSFDISRTGLKSLVSILQRT